MPEVSEKTIGDLPAATDIYNDDLFLLQQNGEAKKLTGSKLTNYVTRDVVQIDVEVVDYTVTPVSTYDSATHTLDMQVNRGPGIASWQKTATVGKEDTYTVTTQDGQQFNYTVTNGDGLVNSVMGVAPTSGTYDVPMAGIMNLIYPVGSIYVSTVSTNPNTLFGMGVWEAIEGKFLVGYDENDTDFGTAGSEGGEKKHQLLTTEIPSHTHGISAAYGNPGTAAWGITYGNKISDSNIGYTGGGEAHNNLPPYLVVYMWKRTG